MREKVTILHTNDVHSHFENWPKIRRFLMSEKKKSVNGTVLTFDIGDIMDRVHPLSEATDGLSNISLMNKIGYDAATIGNNEGIGNSHMQLSRMYEKANFTLVLDNIVDLKTKKRPSWAHQQKVITTPQGTKVGVLGCTAPFPATYAMNNWKAEPVDEVLPSLIKKLRPQVDILVLLSHLGIDTDRALAKKYPELDVILGGHTHHLLEHGEKIGKTLLCAAGKWGKYIGKVTLILDNGKIIDSEAAVAKTELLPEAQGDLAEIESYQKRGEDLLGKRVVAELPHDFAGSWISGSPLMDITLKALEQVTHTQAAILNGGLFLGDLHQGKLTRENLHSILPHPMRVVNVRLNGYNLWRLIREMEKNRNHLRNAFVKGNGFRGKIFGEIMYDGIEYDSFTKSVTWHNQILDPGKDYQIATVDNFIYCPFFPTLEIAGHPHYLADHFLRDIVGDYFAAKYPV
ncbi:bifunctional metallophosphatase/5'-nucleotidase [Liquorilactobacillus oeni]|uniref:Metallophosphoesterase n=1 Tax=Liquorilactobacillus oeni DSM 19972 TaxID=1423777 RepID=A0A0R1MHW8_9LACO|nr:bifunctional metallophosphatase/5'-nucleotidase [Liquorilactobacillus oeni]KRL03987.1 metallophosphoesterase [Liquorilactobacillus oeni DSM 19972]